MSRTHHRRSGVVSAGDRQTAEAGARALRVGGNAVDAAVGACLAAFVCEVALCGPLGGGVALVQSPDGQARALDFFARTPGLDAPGDRELDFADAIIDFGATQQTFHVGRGAAGLGLALHGLRDLHRRYGALPLSVVAEPAIELGAKGYVVGEQMAYILELIAPISGWTPESAALFQADGRAPSAGDRLSNPDLARTLEAFAADPKGTLAGILADFAEHFGPANGGLVTPADIATARVSWLEPTIVQRSGWSIATMPAPSTGGVLIALGLRLLEGVDQLDWLSPAHVEALGRVQQLLLEVRDPDFDAAVRDPGVVRQLLSAGSIDRLRHRLRDDLGGAGRAWPDAPLGSTTHVSALDDDGRVVAITLTNGEGCGYVLPGTGIEVNNLLGEHDINPRGFHVDPPGRPMVTMMAPTIATRGDQLFALGSGGSNRLRNAIMGVTSHLIDFGRDPREAVMAPRVHLEADRESFRLAIEREGLTDEALHALSRRYPKPTLFPTRNMFFGGVHLAHRLAGEPNGVGDPRRGGAVVRVR